LGDRGLRAGEGPVPLGWRVLRALCLLALAVVMVGAAVGKFHRPMAFLRAVTTYEMLPPSLNTVVAVTFPGIEMVAGLMMVAGLLVAFRNGAANRLDLYVEAGGWITAGMMTLFSAVLAVEILRGKKLDCSCFDTLGQFLPFLKAKNVNWGTVLRDLVILALTVPVILREPRRERA
jgi:hypothetical protein